MSTDPQPPNQPQAEEELPAVGRGDSLIPLPLADRVLLLEVRNAAQDFVDLLTARLAKLPH